MPLVPVSQEDAVDSGEIRLKSGRLVPAAPTAKARTSRTQPASTSPFVGQQPPRVVAPQPAKPTGTITNPPATLPTPGMASVPGPEMGMVTPEEVSGGVKEILSPESTLGKIISPFRMRPDAARDAQIDKAAPYVAAGQHALMHTTGSMVEPGNLALMLASEGIANPVISKALSLAFSASMVKPTADQIVKGIRQIKAGQYPDAFESFLGATGTGAFMTMAGLHGVRGAPAAADAGRAMEAKAAAPSLEKPVSEPAPPTATPPTQPAPTKTFGQNLGDLIEQHIGQHVDEKLKAAGVKLPESEPATPKAPATESAPTTTPHSYDTPEIQALTAQLRQDHSPAVSVTLKESQQLNRTPAEHLAALQELQQIYEEPEDQPITTTPAPAVPPQSPAPERAGASPETSDARLRPVDAQKTQTAPELAKAAGPVSPASPTPTRTAKPKPFKEPQNLIEQLAADGIRINVSKKTAAGEQHSDWARAMYTSFNKARGLLTTQGGLALDEAAQYAANRGWIKDGQIETLKEALEKAGSKQAQSTVARGEAQLKTKDTQDEAFGTAVATAPTKTNKEAFPVDTLKIGDSFELNGEKFTVKGIDPDTGEVTVQDGRKFGKQQLAGGTMMHADKGTAPTEPLPTTPEAKRQAFDKLKQTVPKQLEPADKIDLQVLMPPLVKGATEALEKLSENKGQEAILRAHGIKRIVVDRPHRFDLSTQADVDTKTGQIRVNAEADHPVESIFHEVAHLRWEDGAGNYQHRFKQIWSSLPDKQKADLVGPGYIDNPNEAHSEMFSRFATGQRYPEQFKPLFQESVTVKAREQPKAADYVRPSNLKVRDPAKMLSQESYIMDNDDVPGIVKKYGDFMVVVKDTYGHRHVMPASMFGEMKKNPAFDSSIREVWKSAKSPLGPMSLSDGGAPGIYTGLSQALGRDVLPGETIQPAQLQAKTTKPSLTLESPTEDQLNTEAEKARQKREIEEGQSKRLEAKSLDTTGDLLDPSKADNPLFAARKKLSSERGSAINPAELIGPAAAKAKELAEKVHDVVTLDTTPRMARVSEKLATAAREMAYAPSAVEPIVNDMLSRIFPDDYANPEQMAKVSRVLIADRILGDYQRRLARARQLRSAGDTEQAAKFEELANAIAESHDLAGYQEAVDAAKSDNSIMRAIRRVEQLPQPELDAWFKELKRSDNFSRNAGKGANFGVRWNLLPQKKEVQDATAQAEREAGQAPVIPPSGSAANIRPDPFMKLAKSTGKYSDDFKASLMNVYRNRWPNVTRLRFYDALKESGAAVETVAGQESPKEIQGQQSAKLDVLLPETNDQGITRMVPKQLWVRKDIIREARAALQTDLPAPKGFVSKALTNAQLWQFADAIAHGKSLHTNLANLPALKADMQTIARRIPVLGTGWAAKQIHDINEAVKSDSPEIRKELADMARAGLLRQPHTGMGPTKWLGTQKQLFKADQATRVIMNHFFTEAAKSGIVKDTPFNRAKFVSQVGEYNTRLMSDSQRWLKQRGWSPFVVAGRTYNLKGRRLLTGDIGAQMSGPAAAVKSRALNIALGIGGAGALAMMLNMATTGTPGGRPGTPLGAIDLGRPEDKGAHAVFDVLQLMGIRRGLRSTGLNAVIEGVRSGKDSDRIAGEAYHDIRGSALHPWIGPAPAFVWSASTGSRLDMRGGPQPQEARLLSTGPSMKQEVEYSRVALQNQNPLLYSIAKPIAGAATKIATKKVPWLKKWLPPPTDTTFGQDLGVGLMRAPLSALGIQQLKSPAMMLANEKIRALSPEAGYTPKQNERGTFHRDMVDLYISKPENNHEAARNAFQAALKSGKATAKDADLIVKQAKEITTPLVPKIQRLANDDPKGVLEVYQLAGDKEKQQIRQAVAPHGPVLAIARATSGEKLMLVYRIQPDNVKRLLWPTVRQKVQAAKNLTGDEKSEYDAELKAEYKRLTQSRTQPAATR